MALTEEEKEELRTTRIAYQKTKAEIAIQEAELENVIYKRACIKIGKSGKLVGFVISIILFVVCCGMIMLYSDFFDASLLGKEANKSDAVTYSVSATMLVFTFILCLGSALFSIYTGFYAIMERGSSTFAKRLAASHGVRNLPLIKEECDAEEEKIRDTLKYLRRDEKKYKYIIDQLEPKETPWWEQ